MAGRRVVRERIDPRLTAALFSNYRSPIDAVLELVDNAVSITAGTAPAGVAWSLGATVVTRNPDDFVRMGVPVLAYEADGEG